MSLLLWTHTQSVDYLSEDEWKNYTLNELHDFEKDILDKMKIYGWDGVENPEKQQWTQMGALFYSIIVITTIGNSICILFYLFIFYFNFIDLIAEVFCIIV